MNPAPRYFGGSSVKNGRVHILKATCFRELVENYLHVPVPIQMTHADFLAHPNRDDIKDGDFIVACSYAEDECKRVNHTATAVNMVIIDLDEGQFVKDFFESPETLYHALRNYNFCAWLTAKHTPEAPRMKIAVDISPCAPEHHRRVALHLLSLLGIPRDFKGQRETLTLSLPQYRPVCFLKEDGSAVIASRLDGVPVQEADCPEITEGDELADRRYADTENADLLALLHLPDYGITVEDIREPLFKIDPDCEYKVWCFTACALRHQFQDEEQARAAFELWNEWSSQGTKYKGEKATYLKWRSFNPYPVGRPPVTLGTLYKLATDAGWDNSKLAKKVGLNVEDWIAGCTDPSTLMNEGPKRIAELPFKNELVEEALAKMLGDAIKRCGGASIAPATIKKQIDKVRRKELAESKSDDKPSWLLPFCFIGPRNVFYHSLTGDTYSPEAFNNTFSRFLLAKPDPDEPEGSRPAILPQHKALNEVKIKVVDDTIYDPRSNEAYFEGPDGKWYANTFRGKSLPPEEPALAVKAGNLVKRLLKANVANAVYRRTFLDFFAWCIQNQGRKVKWAILFQGAQGCGKGTLIDCVVAAIGVKNFKVVSASAVASDFNDWRQGAMLVNGDEMKSPGKNRHEVTNKFKDAISNDWVAVNEKFKNITNIPNVTNYVFTTNYMDAIAIDDGDRRYFVLQSTIQTKDQVARLRETGIFEEIREMIEQHPGAFRSFFLSHEVSADFPVHGPAPETEWRRDLIEDAKNPLQAYIERLILDSEEPLIGDDVIHYGRLENITEYAARNNAKVSHYLRLLGYTKYDSGVVVEGYPKSDIWVHSRNYFEELGEPEELLRMRVKTGEEI